MKWGILLAVAAGAGCAQTVQVYSEFAQFNDAAEVVSPANPREILSPAVARNAFSSFQLSIQVPKGTRFVVYVGQNPENAVTVTLYRRTATKLERVELPYMGESTQVLWMDLWVDADAPVRRVKIEPQVGIDGDWITYPMEVRVSEAVVPNRLTPEQGFATPSETMRAYLCGSRIQAAAGPAPPGAALLFRNAQQDVALAAAASIPLREELKKSMGGCSARLPADPEFYLRVRDLFFTPLWKKLR